MLSRPFATLAAALVLSLSAPTSKAADRVALVIGNGAYSFATRLGNPTNDATDIAKALREIGFDVVEGTDLSRRAMEEKIRAFSDKLDAARIALFFYAGHGLQVAGKNYLIPIDAKLQRPGDLALDTIDVQVVLQQMEARERINLVFLDACRDNPLARSFASTLGGSRSAVVGQGLATIQSAVGTMIAFATQPDAVAQDGTGRNSPFTAALVKRIRTPGADIAVIMRQVRTDVLAATGKRQVPWDHSSLTDAVVLVPGGGAPAAVSAAPPIAGPQPTARPSAPPPPAPAQAPAGDAAQAWAVTKDTTSVAVLEDFIRQFGKTPYGSMARARLRELKATTPKVPEKVAAATPSVPAPTPAAQRLNVSGLWVGVWANTSGETGKDTLELTEDSGGNISGMWIGTIAVSGRRISHNTIEFSGREFSGGTAKRLYQATGTRDGEGRMTLNYTATRLDSHGSYQGTSHLNFTKR